MHLRLYPRVSQVVSDMPAGQLTKHDVPVDIIVTPTRVIRVGAGRAPKPSGVMWDLLSPQKLAQIKVTGHCATAPRPLRRGCLPNQVSICLLACLPACQVLRDLKQRIEAETGQALPQGPDETLPPTASRGRGRGRGRGAGRGRDSGTGQRGGGS